MHSPVDDVWRRRAEGLVAVGALFPQLILISLPFFAISLSFSSSPTPSLPLSLHFYLHPH